MKRLLCILVAGLLLATLTACGGSNDSSSAPSTSSQGQGASSSDTSAAPGGQLDLAAAMTGFAGATGAGVLGPAIGGNENLCYSPASLYFALSLVSAGAAGETQSQLFELLGVPAGDTAALETAVKDALDSLVFEKETGLPEGYEDTSALEIANSVWLNEEYSFGDAFAGSAEQYWDASLFTAPFGDDETTEAMRSWVSERTNGLIDAAVETDPRDLLVLFNTLYFADNWIDYFEEADNLTGTFTPAGGGEMQAEYLTRSFAHKEYYRGEGYQQMGLPLAKGGRMEFILPDEDADLADLASAEKLAEYLSNDYSDLAKVNLRLPKFDFDSSMALKDLLQSLGVTDAFDLGASDFSALTGSQTPAAITSVTQLSQIAIDEKGVEAAAVSIVAVGTGGLIDEPEQEVDFFLDRPFLFFIEYGGYPLFIGVVARPTAA